MRRLLFEKSGKAIWISHLDLMRVFQRSFKRAGLHLTHTQGFNPRPSVSIALPLSVGVESVCELLDFDLDGDTVTNEDLVSRLNGVLVPGVRVLEAYDTGRKIRDLALLECEITLEYNAGVSPEVFTALTELFHSESLIVPKKGKNGIQDQDIIPMIRGLQISQIGENAILMRCCICCQNPSLNPMQLVAAIERYCPECKPDFAKCRRTEIFDTDLNVFR